MPRMQLLTNDQISNYKIPHGELLNFIRRRETYGELGVPGTDEPMRYNTVQHGSIAIIIKNLELTSDGLFGDVEPYGNKSDVAARILKSKRPVIEPRCNKVSGRLMRLNVLITFDIRWG